MANHHFAHHTNQQRLDDRNLTLARRGVNADLAPDLHVAERAVRVAAYARQVETSGRIVQWLPPASSRAIRNRRDLAAWKRGRQ